MNILYNRFLYRVANQNVDWKNAGTTFRIGLLRDTSTYVPNKDHDTPSEIFSNGGVEITVATYARQPLASRLTTLVDGSDRVELDCADVSFGALESGQTVKAAFIFELVTNDADSQLVAYIDGKINVTAAAPAVASSTGTITGATQANPVVITSANSLANGDEVWIANVGGMTQINNRAFTVAGATGTTFQLSGENGTGHSAYTSGGNWYLIRKVYVDPLAEIIPDAAAVDFGGGATGTTVLSSPADQRYIKVRQLGAAVAEGAVSSNVNTTLGFPAALGGGTFSVVINAAGLVHLLQRVGT